MTVFIVGSGAIGCELLKYLALLGAGDQESGGEIILTDDDTISRSNLNRQFLFCESDIDKPKSERAASSARRINPRLAITPYKKRLAESTEDFFDGGFFERVDVCFAALDSLQARQYLDMRCLESLRPMFDSGTHGLEGHAQPCVPFETRSYGNEVDPDAAEQVGCTVQNFPYKPAHCVQWAKSLVFDDDFIGFPTAFNQLCDELASYVLDDGDSLFSALQRFFDEHVNDPTRSNLPERVASVLKQCTADAGVEACGANMTNRSCLAYGRAVCERLFHHAPRALLHSFPSDYAQNGQAFWAPPKRPPSPLHYEAHDDVARQFVTAYANLWAHIWNADHLQLDVGTADALLQEMITTPLPAYIERASEAVVKSTSEDAEGGTETATAAVFRSDEELRQFANVLQPFFDLKMRLRVVTFEKDVDANFHIDLIHSASTLRSRVYGIPTLSRLDTKRIAGKILPAVASTTSAVAGFIVGEMVKYAAGRKLDEYRSTTLHLGTALFANCVPQSPTRTRISSTMMVSEWERWSWSVSPELTLRELMRLIEAKGSDLVIDWLLQGENMLNLNPANLNKAVASIVEFDETGIAYLQAMFASPDECVGSDETFASPPIIISLQSSS